MSTDTLTRPAVGDTLSCGHARPAGPVPGPTGYAVTGDGRTLCYPCADDSERAAFAAAGDAGEPFVAYVNSAGNLTTWPGGQLARGISYRHGVSRSGVHSWRFRADDGSEWYGRNGGPGMVVVVRRARHA